VYLGYLIELYTLLLDSRRCSSLVYNWSS